MTEPTSPLASDLCTACGLCCAGPLFNAMNLQPTELGQAAALGFEIEIDEDGPHFTMPCVQLAGTCCTIYDDRPAGCRTFRCMLLKRMDEGDVSLAGAMELVESAWEAARLVELELGGETIPQYRRRRTEALLSRGEALPRNPARDRLNQLDAILDQHFRKPYQNQTIPFDEVEGRSGWL